MGERVLITMMEEDTFPASIALLTTSSLYSSFSTMIQCLP